jgi:hypothetical protein
MIQPLVWLLAEGEAPQAKESVKVLVDYGY